jgi:hypothetical protein
VKRKTAAPRRKKSPAAREGGKAEVKFDTVQKMKKGGGFMQHKKKWITIAVLAATLVILAGVVGGTAYAQSATTTTNTTQADPTKNINARVASILGIDQQKLEDAIAQAQKEARDEELNNRLNSMVTQGIITQDQASQYLKWWQSKPDIGGELGLGRDMGFGGGHGFSGGPQGMGPGGNNMTPPATATTPGSK